MQKLEHNEKIANHCHQDADLQDGCWYYNGCRKRLRLIATWSFHTTAKGSEYADAADDQMIDVENVILKFFEFPTKVKVP